MDLQFCAQLALVCPTTYYNFNQTNNFGDVLFQSHSPSHLLKGSTVR